MKKVAPWMPGYEEYAAKRGAARAKAQATRARKQTEKEAIRVADIRARFDDELQRAFRFSDAGSSSIGMPPGGYRAVATDHTDVFGGRWFGIFPGVDVVVGPFQTKTEIERAAEEHAFAHGHGRGHPAPGGKRRHAPQRDAGLSRLTNEVQELLRGAK